MKKTLKRVIGILLSSLFVFSFSTAAFADADLVGDEQGVTGVIGKISITRAATGETEVYEIDELEPGLFEPYVLRPFNWSIAPDDWIWSASSFYMYVGDVIQFYDVTCPSGTKTALRDSSTGTVSNWTTITSEDYYITCKVAGTYNFAFYNPSSKTITVSGSYEW